MPWKTFEKLPILISLTNTRYTPLSTTKRQLFPPSDPPLLCTCPLTRSLTLCGSTAATVVQKNTFCDTAFLGLRDKDTLCLVLTHFKENVCHPFLFVRYFFYMPYCSYKTYRSVDECIVLLLLACAFMDLLFLCLGGKRDRGTNLV